MCDKSLPLVVYRVEGHGCKIRPHKRMEQVMKKFASIALATALAFSLVACGGAAQTETPAVVRRLQPELTL